MRVPFGKENEILLSVAGGKGSIRQFQKQQVHFLLNGSETLN